MEGLPAGRTLDYSLKRAPGEAAGTYAITVEPGENPHYRITAEQGTFTIMEKESIHPTVTIAGWYFGDTPNAPVLGEGSNPGGGKVTYTYKPKDAGDSAYTEEVPTEIGNYTVKAAIAETDAYSGGTAAADFAISSRPSGGGGGGGGGGTAPAVTTNPVVVPADPSDQTTHGSASASANSARAGDKVTVTPEPDEGYATTDVTVTDAKGNAVPVTKNADGTWTFTMPGTAVSVTPVFVKAGETDESACPRDSSCPISKFSDAKPDAWYHDGVHWALEKGVMKGTSGTAFEPNGSATRAMVVTMLWRLAGEPASSASAPFDDVSSGAWYAGAVAWAAETGAVNGTSNTTFSPNTPVTREQLAAILYRYAQAEGRSFTGAWAFLMDFSDAADVSEWADEAMHWMTMNGVITGMGDGTLAPRDNATRAQIATMFQRFVEAMEQ